MNSFYRRVLVSLAAGQVWAGALAMEPKWQIGPFVKGPFVKGTGHWNKAPLSDFESSPGPIPYQSWYGGTGRLILMSSGNASGSAEITERAAAVGRGGLSIKPNRYRNVGMSVAFDGLVAVVPGHTYVLSGFIKRLKPGGQQARIYIDLWGNRTEFLSSPDTTEWQFVYGTFVATQLSYGVRAVIDTDVSGDEAYFDELALTPIEQFELPEVVGAPKQAVARASIEAGKVGSVQVTSAGAAYTAAPTVVLDGGGGTGAVALPVMTNGSIDHIEVIAAGHGYTSAPAVLISQPGSEPGLSIESSPLRKVIYLSAGRECRVVLYLVAGRRYILEESTDLESWASFGNPFMATSGISWQMLRPAKENRYLRVAEVRK